MLIVVTRPLIVIINIILFTIVSGVKLEDIKRYTNEFVLHVSQGEQAARILAEKYQLVFERQVRKRCACVLNLSSLHVGSSQ